jgi:hypothetical protein
MRYWQQFGHFEVTVGISFEFRSLPTLTYLICSGRVIDQDSLDVRSALSDLQCESFLFNKKQETLREFIKVTWQELLPKSLLEFESILWLLK